MKRLLVLTLVSGLVLTSCVSSKKYKDLEAQQKETQDRLNTATVKLNSCLSDKAAAEATIDGLNRELTDLKRTQAELIQSSKELTILTQQGAYNLEKSLESLREKDLKISRLQDAMNKKDSVNLALVTSLKKEVGLDDPDIEINVEGGVVLISLSVKVLFRSGSYNVTTRAKEILGKVATVINSKPEFEALIESHTDDVPYKKGVLLDNWDLSVKRSTAIVRELQELGVNPGQLIAAGRSYYDPLVANDNAANRATNRRTNIMVIPKIDQFYEMIENELETLSDVEGEDGGEGAGDGGE